MDCLLLREPLFLGGQLISGLATGGIYALVALGLVLIYKATEVVNFAQGDLLMLGAYVGWALTAVGLPFPVALCLTLLLAGCVGIVMERLVLRRMVGSPLIAIVIVTLGMSNVFRGLLLLFVGSDVRRFPDGPFDVAPAALGPFLVPQIQVWALGAAAGVVVMLALFFRYSRSGLALRAAADDQQAARSVGISISATFALSWALAAGVAAIGGILLGNLTGVNLALADVGLQVFPVAIVGGLDSLLGAIVAGLVIGVLQNLAAGYLDPCVGGGLKDVAPFIVLVMMLIVKPHGLFGGARIQRV
jgi:branched-chain amino acid transport system permease protein